MSYTIRQNPSPFYTHNRNGQKINKIVIHHAATTNFDGIGRTFKTARVSAHYGVGRNQNVDQYVADTHAAWHAGNYNANMTSIGIENVNSTGAPSWLVSDKTFDTLVELVRDIARRHGLLPLKVDKNLFGHNDFYNTACPGSLKNRLNELASRVNGNAGATSKPSKPNRKSNEEIAREVLAGKWGNNPQRKANLIKQGYNYNEIQKIVNRGFKVLPAPAPIRQKDNATIAREVLAGSWGNGTERQANLLRAGYNYAQIQNEVNRLVGIKKPLIRINRKSDQAIAEEVIKGKWGNNPARANSLKKAGYNPSAIQALVNRRLGY